jgi:hypothetical protein
VLLFAQSCGLMPKRSAMSSKLATTRYWQHRLIPKHSAASSDIYARNSNQRKLPARPLTRLLRVEDRLPASGPTEMRSKVQAPNRHQMGMFTHAHPGR